MAEIFTPSEKALRYVQREYGKHPELLESSAKSYLTGYLQAEADNPLRWRDPNKEYPDYLKGIGCTVLAAVRRYKDDDLPTTRIATYNGLNWRIWDYDKQCEVDVDRDLVAAWMPLPSYRENKEY